MIRVGWVWTSPAAAPSDAGRVAFTLGPNSPGSRLGPNTPGFSIGPNEQLGSTLGPNDAGNAVGAED